MNVHPHPVPEELSAGVTLDSLFRATVATRPEKLAIADPANRESFTDGPPLRLTYAAADARVERLANILRSFSMPPGSVVAIQLPNIAESAISLLAVLRAGHVAAPVPILWRRSDLVAALGGIAPKAMITLSRLHNERPAEILCEAAAELFELSFPCAFGADVPDGVVPLDRHEQATVEADPSLWRSAISGVSIVTFDADAEGFFPTGRADAQWLAAGLATLLEAKIETGDTIVTAVPFNSLAGIAAGFVPWLLAGGPLELMHGPSSSETEPTSPAERVHLVAPAVATATLARDCKRRLASCIAVHRDPGSRRIDFSGSPADHVVDLYTFGEIGAVPLARRDKRVARPFPLGGISAPYGAAGAPVVIEVASSGGQVGLRGPMVPWEAFPPGLGSFRTMRDGEGFVRTGYKCRNDGTGGLIVDGSPDRVILVGSLRFGLNDLQSRFSACVEGIRVAIVDDPLLGQRLQIDAADRKAAAEALGAAGHSQLMIEAVVGASAKGTPD